jgi:hypothetical protein
MNYDNSAQTITEDKLIMHFMFGEKIILRNAEPIVASVTACAWVDAPNNQITLDLALVTCPHCLKRA